MSTEKTHFFFSERLAIPRLCSRLAYSLFLTLFLAGATSAQQATLTDDANTESSKPAKNFGDSENIKVSPTEKGFLKFKISPVLPNETTGDCGQTIERWTRYGPTTSSYHFHMARPSHT